MSANTPDFKILVRGCSRSLKMVPFDTLGMISCLHCMYSNYGCIFSRFDAVHERDRHPATAQQQRPRLGITPHGNNTRTMFVVLLSWHGQCKSSHGLSDVCRAATTDTWTNPCLEPPVSCYGLHPPLPFIVVVTRHSLVRAKSEVFVLLCFLPAIR